MGLLENAKRMAAAEESANAAAKAEALAAKAEAAREVARVERAKENERLEAIQNQSSLAEPVAAAWIARTIGIDPAPISMTVIQATPGHTSRKSPPDDWGGPHFYDHYEPARTVLAFVIEGCEFVATVSESSSISVTMCVGIDSRGARQYQLVTGPSALVQAILAKDEFFRTYQPPPKPEPKPTKPVELIRLDDFAASYPQIAAACRKAVLDYQLKSWVPAALFKAGFTSPEPGPDDIMVQVPPSSDRGCYVVWSDSGRQFFGLFANGQLQVEVEIQPDPADPAAATKFRVDTEYWIGVALEALSNRQ